MTHDENDRLKLARSMSEGIRELLLDADESEIRDAVSEAGEDYEHLASRGRAAVQSALAKASDDVSEVEDLHRGLGALLQMLRRRDRISIDDLAKKARVDASELQFIERDAQFQPSPRTVYRLEQHFDLPARSLIVLSGVVTVDTPVRDEAVRFAASAKDMTKLTREEKKVLNEFVKFLREHTD